MTQMIKLTQMVMITDLSLDLTLVGAVPQIHLTATTGNQKYM